MNFKLFEEFINDKIRNDVKLRVFNWIESEDKILTKTSKEEAAKAIWWFNGLGHKGASVSLQTTKYLIDLANIVNDENKTLNVEWGVPFGDNLLVRIYLCKNGNRTEDFLEVDFNTTSKDVYNFIVDNGYLKPFIKSEMLGLKYKI